MGHAGTANIERTDSGIVNGRLGWLIAENHRIAREKALYRNDRERLEALTMRGRLKISQAYRWFGFLLGSVTPAAIVAKALANDVTIGNDELLFTMLITLAGLLAGTAGYFSGKLAAKTVERAKKFSLPNRAAVIAFVGMTWGIACGAVGGLLIFLIGAIPAAFIGGITAAATLPIFATLLDLARRGDQVGLSHFLPISLGIVLSIAAFILGL